MKSNYYLFLLIFISFFTTSAWGQRGPGLKWVGQFSTNFLVSGSATDANHNTIVAGNFNSGFQQPFQTFDFDPGPDSLFLTGYLHHDCWIAKFDFKGDLLWAKTIAGNGYEGIYKIETTSTGDIIAVGAFTDTLDFDPNIGVSKLSAQGNAQNTFILKLDTHGNFIWAKSFYGGQNYPTSFKIDNNDNFLIHGIFNATGIDYNPGSQVSIVPGSQGNYMVKLNVNGQLQWAKHITNKMTNSLFNMSQDGKLFFFGLINQNTSVGNFSKTLIPNGQTDFYIMKLNANGNYQWAYNFGSTNTEIVSKIDVDPLGNLLLTGRSSGPFDADPKSTFVNFNADSNFNSFMITLDTDANLNRAFFPDSNSTSCFIGSAKLQPNKSIIYSAAITDSNNISSTFIKKIDSSNSIVWTDTLSNIGIPRIISIDANESIIYRSAGDTSSDIDPDTSTYNFNYPCQFISRLSNCTNTYRNDTIIACSTYTWINGISYDSSVIYTDTLVNSFGCDSLISLHLTILDSCTTTIDSISQCSPILWLDSVLYDQSTNSPYHVFYNVQPGYDSIVKLEYTNLSYDSISILSSCDSLTWINGIKYYASNNSDSIVYTNQNGCDSTIFLNLTINHSNVIAKIDTVMACGSYTWVDGITYSSNNNTAIDTLTNSFGCDSVVQLNLTILPTFTSVDTVHACGPITWMDSITYTSSTNSPTFTLTAANGCDSVVTLNFTRHPAYITGIDQISACDSITWINGITYYNSTYFVRDTIIGGSQYGCDSISILLFTESSNNRTEVYNECNSFTWINGVTYTASNNTDSVVYTNALGCDSTIYLDLTINYSTTSTDVITACDSIIWIDGLTYTSSNNTAIDTLVNSAGCDSIVSLDLTITNSSLSSSIASACGSYAWANTGVTYYNTGVYYDTLVNGAGCDSIVSLGLTIHAIYNQTETYTVCDSFTWSDGTTYNASNNTAQQIFTSVNGCDSIVNLDLTIYPSFDTTETYVLCDSSFTWIDGITYTASNSTASHTFTSVNGCDSVISLNLTLTPIDTSVNRTTLQLQANHSGASYQWLDCEDNYSSIPGETNRILVITKSGSYAVQITNSNCVDTSSCFEFVNVGVNDISINHNINVYPNPTSDFITIDLQNVTQSSASIRIIELHGKTVYNKSVTKTNSPWTEQVDMSAFATGSYFVKIVIDGKESSFAVSKL